jgi:hypothetical protein
MKDTDKIILKAFLAALSQQQSPLSDEVKSQLADIAQSLDNRVRELDAIANNNLSLKPFYLAAYDNLVGEGSERAKGLDSIPAKPSESDTGREISNITRKVNVEDLEKVLEILAAANPITAAKQAFK